MKRKVHAAIPKITGHNLQGKVPVNIAELKKFAAKALQDCLCLPRKKTTNLMQLREISILIVSDRKIASFHRQFMNESGPTDVITFQHGEIFISVPTAQRQARRFGTSLRHEVQLYIVHGLLHLLGFNDQTGGQRREMRAAERAILAQVAV